MRRARAAGRAAIAGRVGKKPGDMARIGDGLMSHLQHAMMNASSTLFSL